MNHLDVPTITIVEDTCKNDGLCVKICPTRIFRMADGQLPTVSHLEECILCGQCVSVCPNQSIVHSQIKRLRKITDRSPVTSEAAYELLSQRRSVRMYKKDVPPHDLLERIVEVAGYSPNSPFHRIGWLREFVVVSGPENMAKVHEMTVEWLRKMHGFFSSWYFGILAKMSAAAQGGRMIVPDFEMRLKEHAEGRDAITYNAPAAIFAIAPTSSTSPQIDCDSAMLSILLMAHAHGLGTCWNGLIQGAAASARMKEFLKIPKGYKCYAAATIGYPAVKLHSVPQRDVSIKWVE
jgi:nitroreductase/NAD-dependent dihydropyrimidine dehydrogenase PreA subunit